MLLIHVACLHMCVLFYFFVVCLHLCAYAFKFKVHCGRKIFSVNLLVHDASPRLVQDVAHANLCSVGVRLSNMAFLTACTLLVTTWSDSELTTVGEEITFKPVQRRELQDDDFDPPPPTLSNATLHHFAGSLCSRVVGRV